MNEKHKVRIGNRYAYFIAWTLRNEGWDVMDRSSMKFYDRGIDLIASKNGVTQYIQCKGWSWRTQIHENVVNQFFGSVASVAGLESISDPNVEKYIYSSANPTAYARDKAKKLNVEIVKANFPNWWKRKRQYI